MRMDGRGGNWERREQGKTREDGDAVTGELGESTPDRTMSCDCCHHDERRHSDPR